MPMTGQIQGDQPDGAGRSRRRRRRHRRHHHHRRHQAPPPRCPSPLSHALRRATALSLRLATFDNQDGDPRRARSGQDLHYMSPATETAWSFAAVIDLINAPVAGPGQRHDPESGEGSDAGPPSTLGNLDQVWRYLRWSLGQRPQGALPAPTASDGDVEATPEDAVQEVAAEDAAVKEDERASPRGVGPGHAVQEVAATSISEPIEEGSPPANEGLDIADDQRKLLHAYLRDFVEDHERRKALEPAEEGPSTMTTAAAPALDHGSGVELRGAWSSSVDPNAVLAPGPANGCVQKGGRRRNRQLNRMPSVTAPPFMVATPGAGGAPIVWAPDPSLQFLPGPRLIVPLVPSTPTQRKGVLMTQLVQAFPSERQYLLNASAMQLSLAPALPAPNGIHVFVDASNIMIGFHETLKKTRRIGQGVHTRLVPFSFHSFALILERGRPVAKRILVGSGPRTAALAEAERCGYEANILHRVAKATLQSPRRGRGQHQHQHQHQQQHDHRTGTSGAESGSDTAVVRSRMVEQGVDEILHLKILESVVDVARPATIVLATGDAAEAEFSGGFLRMAERALQKGWSIELVSFSRNTSAAYQRRDFQRRWKKRFQIIYLDPYAELLLDM